METSRVQHYVSRMLALGLDPNLFVGAVLKFTPDEWQSKVLLSSSKRRLLLCCRQCGKSTIVAAICLYIACFNRGSLILVGANKMMQAKELIRKIKLGANVVIAEGFLRKTHDNTESIEFSNGSRILAISSADGSPRGFTPNYVVIDEAAHVSDEFYHTLRPTLAVSNGTLIAMSTAFGKRGWFYNAWENDDSFEKTKVTASECDRLSQSFLDEEKRVLPERFFEQEYFCKFVSREDSCFNYDLFLECITDTIEEINIKIF